MTPANDNGLGVPPGVYTAEQAAAFLRIGIRALRDLIKTHKHYSANGRRKLFSKANIDALWEAMQCPNSPSQNVLGQTVGISAALTTPENLYSNLLEPPTTRQPKRSSSRQTRAS